MPNSVAEATAQVALDLLQENHRLKVELGEIHQLANEACAELDVRTHERDELIILATNMADIFETYDTSTYGGWAEISELRKLILSIRMQEGK